MDGSGVRYTSPSGSLLVDDKLTFKRKGGCFVSKSAAMFIVILIVVLLAATAILTRHFTKEEYKNVKPDDDDSLVQAKEITRLSGDVIPVHYKIMLEPYLNVAPAGRQPFQLVGHVKILLDTKSGTSSVQIHGVGLNISESQVKLVAIENYSDSNGPSVKPDWGVIMASDLPEESDLAIKSITENSSRETYTITLERPMEANKKYMLAINYTAPINESTVGIYASSYKERAGKQRWIAESNFKPTFARRAFPCFDEPSYKATFDISILRLSNMTSLSNSKKINSETTGLADWTWDHYATTPLMSTHLLAVVVFDFSKRRDLNKIELNVWTRQEDLLSRNYQNPSVAKYLLYYSNYFGVPYELPKLDLVALPHASSPASANWGLIKFKESQVLATYPQIDTRLLFSRALIQQWFGNLVTAKWWNDNWLMESIATYFQYAGGKNMGGNIMDYFIADVFQDALMEDSLNSSKALISEESDSTDIFEFYDEASFKKGAALIHMLRSSLGSTIFDNGIKHFLEEWSHKNVETDDFWNSFAMGRQNKSNKIDDLDVKEIMKSWISGSGYPVLDVKYDAENGKIHLEQKKFRLENSSRTNSDLRYIPIKYITKFDTAEKPTKTFWMKAGAEATTISMHEKNESNWVLFHLSYPGFYRINYDERNWYSLMKDFMADINFVNYTLSKAQIIDDSFQLARAGLLNYSVPLNMTKYLIRSERQFLPWHTAITNIRFLELFFWDSPHYSLFHNYVEQLTSPLYNELKEKYQNEPSILVPLIFTLACDNENSDCLSLLKNVYDSWKSNNEQIPSAIKDIVYCHVIRTGGKNEIEFFWDLYQNNILDQVEQTMILKGLACSSMPWAINMLLNETLNKEIPLEDVKTVWLTLSKRPTTAATAFTFLKKNWETILNKFHTKSDIMREILRHYGKTLTTEVHLSELMELKKYIRTKYLRVQLEKAIQNVQHNINWRTAHLPHVISWLNEFKQGYDST